MKADKPFTIKPGPNNPVGVVWIGLSKRGYGIHGTSDPSKISKTASHGCIRLTNWDALISASAVSKGVPVEFTGGKTVATVGRGKSKSKARTAEHTSGVVRPYGNNLGKHLSRDAQARVMDQSSGS